MILRELKNDKQTQAYIQQISQDLIASGLTEEEVKETMRGIDIDIMKFVIDEAYDTLSPANQKRLENISDMIEPPPSEKDLSNILELSEDELGDRVKEYIKTYAQTIHEKSHEIGQIKKQSL